MIFRRGLILLGLGFVSAGFAHAQSGLALEEAEQGSWKILRKQARDFLEFRRGRMTNARKLAWINDCVARPDENVFCDFMNSASALAKVLRSGDVADPAPRYSSREISEAVEKFRKADFASLRQFPEQKLLRALKQFNEWPELQFIAQKAQEARSCPGSGILTALGLKTEEFFPDDRYKRMSRAFYTRSSECGGDEDSAYKARYRLAMLHIWDGECDNAVPVLERLATQKNGDYVARALFWSNHCAAVSGNQSAMRAASARLLKEFPLSYHGLLLSSQREVRAREVLSKQGAQRVFRTKLRPELNPIVRGIEALQSLPLRNSEAEEAVALSREMLEAVTDPIMDTEVGFRLYVASLMARARMGNDIFRTLAGIFRDEPAAISRASLELFYPLHRFEDLKRHGWRVDPYLVAALIRQESGFNAHARSTAGALGLMQLMPGTARRMERVSKRDLLDAKTNIRLGVKYFDKLLARYGYDAELALAAYNAGPEKVDDWIKRYPIGNRVLFFDMIPFRETRDYVALISRNYYWYKNLYGSAPQEANRIPASQSDRKTLRFTLFGR